MNKIELEYKSINSRNGTLGLNKIKLKILKFELESHWCSDHIGEELLFWDKKFTDDDDSECLWCCELYGEVIYGWIHINCTNYNVVTRKDKLIKNNLTSKWGACYF